MQTPTEPQALTPNQATQATHPTPPAPGEYWPGQGGIYVGIARSEPGQAPYHLILAEAAPETNFNWQAGMNFAKTITADGHADFSLPTRFESALLYANVRDKIDTDYWYWTSTQYSEGYASSQHFDNGTQDVSYKEFARRCRFVRRLILQSFNSLAAA